MKKTIAFLLAAVMVFMSVSFAFADDARSSAEKEKLNSAVERIQEEIPAAEIRVVEGVIHVVVEDFLDIPGTVVLSKNKQTRTTTVTSSEGGSYRNFDVPWYAYSSFAPYSQVYMKKDVVDALKLQMLEPEFYEWILQQIDAGVAAAMISKLALSLWGITIPAGVVAVIGSLLAWGGSNLEYWSLKTAQDSSTSGKVYIVRGTTAEGYDSVFYSPWNDNICATYAGYDAVWYGGVYDV